MKIRILGFEADRTLLPAPTSPIAGFEWLEKNQGIALSPSLTAAVTQTEGLFAGVLLKSRDSISITKILSEGGIRRVKSEKLPDGQQLGEVNFFVVSPKTGRGLYAYHHLSASLTSDFAWTCAKAFNFQRGLLLDAALAEIGLTTKEKEAVRKSHRGRFKLVQMLNQGGLAEFLKKMKRVSAFEASFSSFELKEDVFDPLSKKARKKTVRFQFPPDLALSTLEDDLEKAAASPELEDFWVDGVDKRNRAEQFHRNKNRMVFEEYEYNDLLGDFEIRFDDWSGSIVAAEVTKKLVAIANSDRVSRMLKAPI